MTAPNPTRRVPFWTWGDAVLFLALLAPAILLASGLTLIAFMFLAKLPPDSVRVMLPMAMIYGFWFAALWLMLKLRYDEPFWESMAWRVPWPRMLLTLGIGPLLVVCIIALGAVLHMPEIDNPIQHLLQDTASIVLVGLFATTLGPLAEELAFRGFLQPLMIRTTSNAVSWLEGKLFRGLLQPSITHKIGIVLGVVFASLPFTLAHGKQYSWSWQHLLLLFLASMTFGIVRQRTQSTAASTLVHSMYNLAFLIGYLLQRKELLN